MLKIKKLQILGFKSFCDRSELKFPGEGIACIVGPNGCGKSNISDAIAWVLGEQSARTLRGARMEDVIFAGSRDRKPTGMAEVSLTLVDPDVYEGDANAEPEVEVENELPEDDWDEASLRASSMQDAERYLEEVQPGQSTESPVDGQRSTAEAEAVAASDQPQSSEHSSAANDYQLTTNDTPAANDQQPTANDNAAGSDQQAAAVEGAIPSVVLKIRRRKFKPAFKAGEIVVTRRLFRSGDSEYLLNGKLCRLRDIQDIFLGTGLGPESYAIIEQGRIGQILSSKPTDRRAIIEEAAGITKFKTRKRLAEVRLEEAKLNLARVNDIFEEVTRQVNSLKRQASKAERYARLREELRGKLRRVLASKIAQLRDEQGQLESELNLLAEQIAQQGESLRGLEAESGERTQRGYAIDGESRQNRDRLAAITRDADRAASLRKYNEERCAELIARAQQAAGEIAQTEQRLAALESERSTNRQILEAASAAVAAAQQEAVEKQREAVAASAALAQVEQEQEQLRVRIMEAVSGASAVHGEITRAQENLAGLGREAARVTGEMQSALKQVEGFGGQRGQLAFEFETASQRVASLAQQIDDARTLLEHKRAAESESRQRLDGLRAELATAQGRKSSLEGLIAEHGYSTESVRRLFQSGVMQNGFAPVGVLADFLEVDDRYEGVVEDFLREELNFIVVKSWDAADEGLRLLRTDVDGRATFLVHPSDSQAKFSFAADENGRYAPANQAVVSVKSCIRVLNGFGKSLEVILPKLRDGYIAPDPGVARELALENPEAFFLSQSGETFHNVTVTGGKQRAQGPLSMKRELREAARQMAEIETILREEEGRWRLLGREIGELTSLLERIERERREGESQLLTSGHNLRQLDAEMTRVRERMELCHGELERLSGERAAREEQIAGKQAELAERQQQRAELEAAAAQAQQSLSGLRSGREAAAQAAAEAGARLAGLEERRRAAEAALTRIDALAEEVAFRLQALRMQQEEAATERARREAENLEIVDQLAALAQERDACEVREQLLQVESEQIRLRLEELEQELKAARAVMDQTRDRRGDLSAQAARLESDGLHLAETSLNELGVTDEDLLADAGIERASGDLLAEEDAACREMRARLEAMGPVNMMALEEYQEAQKRHEFLETQRRDLLDSIANTQAAIREIEMVSRQKFQEAFARINENFQLTFQKLFGGGNAFMRLTDEENTAESGIDVVASPPGKKLQNVLLLSGGEKALTALALLVGIFQYQPSPFCILDEVDAPLDESNVGRFTQLVQEMSARTQFVLITHSKKTMSMAPVMYGVTMQEPGVSKLVSVRFHGAGENVASA